MGLPIYAVAAGKNRFDIRPDFHEFVEEFTAVHTGHNHVKQDKVDFILVSLKNVNGFLPGIGGLDLVAHHFQKFRANFEQHGLVIHVKNVSLACGHFLFGLLLDLGVFFRCRQINMDGRTLVRLRFYFDVAVVGLDNPIHGG